MRKIIFTKQGYDDLLTEKNKLAELRVGTIKDLQKAREMGDLSENGFYKATKMRLGQLDHRLFEIDMLMKGAIIAHKQNTDVIVIGSNVGLILNKRIINYSIVGDTEANLMENKISSRSPLGSALMGKRVGDWVEIKLPKHAALYNIISID